jgi:hypothetical protein
MPLTMLDAVNAMFPPGHWHVDAMSHQGYQQKLGIHMQIDTVIFRSWYASVVSWLCKLSTRASAVQIVLDLCLSTVTVLSASLQK